jgi:hypothetical protein
MPRRAYIMQFDKTTSGGLVLGGDPDTQGCENVGFESREKALSTHKNWKVGYGD